MGGACAGASHGVEVNRRRANQGRFVAPLWRSHAIDAGVRAPAEPPLRRGSPYTDAEPELAAALPSGLAAGREHEPAARCQGAPTSRSTERTVTSCGDRTPGLHYADDGSLTIRPGLRMYSPDGAVFDGTYELPPITRVD